MKAFSLFILLTLPALGGDILFKLGGETPKQAVELRLYDSANAFGDFRDALRVQRFEPGEVLRLKEVPPGDYAIMLYLDENANGQLDENFLGIPREPVGFSNGYRPKGPPSYDRARFTHDAGERVFEVDLERPLGKRGRIAVGAGVIGRSSPYPDYDGGVFQFIPALTYIGERVQILGPNAQVGLFNAGPFKLAARARFAIRAYDEDDSPILEGLGDRENTMMLGPVAEWELPQGYELRLGYEHDVLDRIGGGEARLGLGKSFSLGILRATPEIGLSWMSEAIADHAFGVPANRARADRPAYAVGDALNPRIGLGTMVELSRDWRFNLSVSAEWLDDTITDSPIVDEDVLFSGFSALSYSF